MFREEELLAITEILLDVIKDNNHSTIEYGQLTTRLAKEYRINISPKEVGSRLDEINRVAHELELPHISVIVVPKGENLPGKGFYKLMRKLNPMYTKEIDNFMIWDIERKKLESCSDWSLLLHTIHTGRQKLESSGEQELEGSQDKRQIIYQYSKDIVEQKGFILDQCHKSCIRFSSNRLDNIVGFEGEGWTNSRRVLLFEIENSKSRYALKLIIGPAESTIREGLFNIARKNTNIYNKASVSLTDSWTTIYSNKFLSEEELITMTVQQIQSEIDRRLDQFIERDLEQLYGGFEIEENHRLGSNRKWIIPCNVKYYNVEGAFKRMDILEWKQRTNVEKGDIVYIYIGNPWKQIRYKCIAIAVDMPVPTIDDSEYILDGTVYENYGRYMRLKLLEEYAEGLFTYSQLKENGLVSVQGPTIVSDELEGYIERERNSSDYSYPIEYRTPISVSTTEWEKLLKKEDIFTRDNIDLLKRIYLASNHVTTCYELAKDEGKHPSSYNKPIVELGKRVSKALGLREIKGADNKATWWRVVFWGQELENKHFEWRIRPELARAIASIYPEVEDVQVIKEFTEKIEEVESIESTEKQVLVKSRVGHGALKKKLLQKEHSCRICGLQDEHFLIASHIKPWSEANDTERLDLDNVLLLCPHHDSAFDKGYISFNDEGKILISEELTLQTQMLLNLEEDKQIQLTEKNKFYIKWHRENLFKG